MHSDNQKPCDWGRVSEITRRYHDEEWGMPVRDDKRQFVDFSRRTGKNIQ